MKKYRIAIVGAGGIVGAHIAAIASHADRVELVALVDIDQNRVEQICHENRIPNAYTSVSEMLERERPDLVHVITPSATHTSLSIQCLKAGAWVFCEKPLCGSLAEFDAITRAEAETGRYVSTVFQWRFGSAGKHLKKLIDTGALGKPLVGVCNTLWYRTQDYYGLAWRGTYQDAFGGPTVTLGIHLMDLFLWLMGDWEEIRAMTGTLDRDIEVEDVSMALVRFANGAMTTVTNSALSPRQESYMRFDFQKASVECTTLYRYNNEHWKISLPPHVDEPDTLAQWEALTEDVQGSHEQQLRELLDSMDAGQRPFVSGSEARRIIEFISCLYKSAKTGLPVKRGDLTAEDPFYFTNKGIVEVPA
ncbi:MAG: Gfo/Idh/MocA family oxidoreductase [Chloroflexi bacterium]|nr:Gfo/Idh/MocA family oxidoreductase [Chloroflexota bacterium]MCC6897314.1 Gfo/Idh/MocA family oxidoreductase [Anaerolineae bacterium]